MQKDNLGTKPIIAIASMSQNTQEEEELISAGANYYFYRPVNMPYVNEKIVQLLTSLHA